MNNVFFSMPALSLKLPIPILWVFFIPQFKLIFPIKQENIPPWGILINTSHPKCANLNSF